MVNYILHKKKQKKTYKYQSYYFTPGQDARQLVKYKTQFLGLAWLSGTETISLDTTTCDVP